MEKVCSREEREEEKNDNIFNDCGGVVAGCYGRRREREAQDKFNVCIYYSNRSNDDALYA